ncbi:TPA: hypothetical protein RQJ98_001341 [Vibrio vulnificus]|uniref:hypothetical protein n=1 Tax=Vibrio vulnificus TaxID=672 RepID=UPI0005F0FF46|nr:hypothetical protein [Vibrio vulnificus]HAS6305822.1 hypothetical protein [Vibrio vulnificus]HAS6361085.1 hypothetical protein [Vibrio vulnificus]HAS8361685.1 hypothetical protein [Vibrio vulnificus]HDY7541492.1 hypothetical protein [Vibrio vulnificus]HDY7577520.1 hypothetical protein [Vibrio vulnificus]
MKLQDSIQVHYDGKGEDIKAHLMPSPLVADSVKAFDTLFAEAFKEANRVYGSKIEAKTYIEGGFGKGSLKWLQNLVSSQNEEQIDTDGCSIQLRVTEAISKAVNILLRIDTSIPEIVIKEGSDGFEVELGDGTAIADELVCSLITNPKVRKAISELAKPLAIEGIDTLTIQSCTSSFSDIEVSKETAVNLTKKREHFYVVEEGSFTGFYRVEDLSYNPKKAWKFISIEKPSDTFNGTIDVEQFWSSVAANEERFAHDDVMKLSVSWTKSRKSLTARASTTYVVTSIEHYDGEQMEQCKMF